MAQRQFCIYALVDPVSDEVRYVGKTLTHRLLGRLASHVCDARRRKTHKERWIARLLESEFRPTIRVLEEGLTEDSWRDAERAHIERHQATLTNQNEGGAGRASGFSHSPETRRKMATAARPVQSPEARQRISDNSGMARTYLVTRPDGQWIEVHNLCAFAREHGLAQGYLRRTMHSPSRQHRGFRVEAAL